jgi:hypothetical protein
MSAAAAAKPWLVFVGGFLGAGKTALILAAGRELERRGISSATVMNDQGDALVDAGLSARQGRLTAEVTGGCFCCRFSALLRALEGLRAGAPEVIFAEPVGSCADISATTLRPLLELRDRYRLAPFTVLADPRRAVELLSPDADPNLAFLFRKQIEEADLVCYTKSDLSFAPPAQQVENGRRLSAKTGQGVAAWLDEVLSGRLAAAERVLEIDYAQYARAEAALVWLNLQARIEPRVPCSPPLVLGPFLEQLDRGLTAEKIVIVHMKAIVDSPEGWVKAAQCANGEPPEVEGDLAASPAARHDLLLNLRALGSAAKIRAIVERALGAIEGVVTEPDGAPDGTAPDRGPRIRCFHPAAPRPERRIANPG